MNRSSPRRSDGLYACVTSRGCVQTTRLTLVINNDFTMYHGPAAFGGLGQSWNSHHLASCHTR
jgi:hypothetical protein